MKTNLKSLALAAASGLIMLETAVAADAGIGITANVPGVQIKAVADFYAPLAAEGTWVSVGDYGRCWHPRGVAANWRPYCNGQWVLTDDGWYWQSDEPWAWACYHYGTWEMDPTYGWIWVPGLEWAPAWVVWRSGGGYVGWAPCAPRGVSVDTGLFAFVPTAHFDERISPGSVIFNNPDVIRQTKVLGASSRGPAVTDIQRATGHEIKTMPLKEARARTQVPSNLRQNTTPLNERWTAPLKERTPGDEQIAPSRGANPAPPFSQESPRNREQVAPGREENGPSREAPPAGQRNPRTEGVSPSRETPSAAGKTPKPGSERPPTNIKPQQQRPAEQPHSSEEQKGNDEKRQP